MNIQEQINNIINPYLDLLPTNSDNFNQQSEIKASKFLVALTKLAALRDQLLNDKVKKDSLLAVEFNSSLSIQKAGDAKAREVSAKANPEYLAVKEEVEMLDNKLLYIKTMMEIFNNSHLLYRAMMKGEM